MDHIASISLLVLSVHLTFASYCIKQLTYHEEYGYGTDITCEDVTPSDKKPMDLASYHPTYLRITRSLISGVGPEIFEDVSVLKVLEIINSTFLLNTTVDIFQHLKELKTLVICNSKLGSITQDSFHHLVELTDLKLSDVSISSLASDSLKPLSSLVSLDLSNNTFTTVNSIPFCEVFHLKDLNLEGNKLEDLESSRFVCKVEEDSLDFDLNTFKYEISIPQPLSYNKVAPVSHLTRLVLRRNTITRLSHCFSDLSKLEILDLEDNKLRTFSGFEFNSLVSLQEINLKSNLIVNISDTVFLKSKALRKVMLANNKLVNVIIRNLPLLADINLAANNIDPVNLAKWNALPNLKKLDLSYNNIKYVPNHMFININNISTLDLSGNLVNLTNATFKYLPKLKILTLRYSNLSELPTDVFKGLTKLETLDLSKNELKSINYHGIFEDQINLEILNISYNKLEILDKTIFKPLKNLMVLSVESNNLKKIDFDIISNLRYLRTINISNNKFSCEFLTDLLKYLEIKKIRYSHDTYDGTLRKNVGGVPCFEAVQSTTLPDTSVFHKNVTQISKLISSNSTQEGLSTSSVAGVTISVLILFSLIGFLGYKYYRKKTFLTDHFELIGE